MHNKKRILHIALLIFSTCLAIYIAYIFKKPAHQSMLHVLRGHKTLVTSLTFSPNGEYLASADESGVIKLWSVTTFKLIKQFELQGRISGISFLPDNQTLVSSDFKGNLIFWSIKTSKIKWDYKTAPILSMSVSDTGIMAISTWQLKVSEPEKNQIVFIDYRHNKIIKRWKMEGISHRPKTIGLSHNGKQIAYVNMEDTFLLKNVSDEQTIWKLKSPTYGIFMPRNGIEFSLDDTRIATTFSDMNASAQVLRSDNGTSIAEIVLVGKVSGNGISVSYTARSEKLLVLTNHNEALIASKDGRILEIYKGDNGANYLAIKASPSKNIFAIADEKNVEIWSIN